MWNIRDSFIGVVIMILFSVGTIATGSTAYIVGIIVWIIFVIIAKGRILLKNIYFPYFPLFVYGVIISIIMSTVATFNLRNLLTGIINLSNPLLFLSIGAILTLICKKNSFLKYIVFSGTFVAIFQLCLLVINISTADSINSLRMSMLPTPNIITITLILLMYKKNLNIDINKNITRIAFIITLVGFIASFSRTLILELLLYILVFSINRNFIKRNITVYFTVIIGATASYYFFINSTIGGAFIEKIIKSSTEVSSDNNWNQLSTILSNWRGYEVYSALNQFNFSNIFNKIFGEGLASQIYIGPYANYVGVNGVSIPYLHNSYYTILIKLGYVGLVYYILFIVINFLFYLKRSYYNTGYLLVVAIIAILALNSKLMQGVIIMGHDAVLLVILGYLAVYVNKHENMIKNLKEI